ncbi:hypothetical protein FHS83_001279 [Rhizomicrobium palustre]|uniref:Uncharacterized protein n=1 Tax=Rhizomicrobium palustre TaxID=189966 RepID=A0A846MXU9_9PROT|nr:hypothetical protein [Rhizomicrobium palustre]NIK87961.1 hypothetical protein [Rhizomicrobium palustre]
MVTRILLGLLTVFAIARAEAADTPKQALDAATKVLSSHTDGFYLDHKAGAETALDNFRTAAQRWAVAYLDAHPKAAPSALKAAAEAMDRELSITFTPLAPELMAVSASYGELGNVFLLAKQGTHYAVVWDIRKTGPDTARDNGWGAMAAFGDGCGRCCDCRALYGDVYALPPDAAGHIRFYIDGGYAQPAGATRGAEISIWAWDGKAAKALFKGDYVSVADDLPIVEAKDDTILVHPKTQYRMFYACGACSGRKLTWTLKLTGDGVRDLGKRVDLPEADAVDEVFLRLWQGKGASALAAPKVLEKMAAIVAETKKSASDPNDPNLGMLSGIDVKRNGDRATLTYDTAVAAAPKMVATVLHKKSGYYLEAFDFSLKN